MHIYILYMIEKINGKSQNPATYIKIGRNLLSRTSLKGYANKSK